jgi:GAF domain-containing protein
MRDASADAAEVDDTERSRVPRSLLEVIREFAETVAQPYDRDAVLDQLVRDTPAVLGADGAGVMLPDTDGHLRFATSADDRVREVERLQEDERQGACAEAYHTGEVVAVDHLEAETRWPAYRRRCEELGLRAVVGVPMATADRTIGVLNVYRSQPSRWTAEDIEACRTLASIATAYLLNASRREAAEGLAVQLQHALDARIVIEQAKGVVMSTQGVDADDALEMLRRAARSRSRKLLDVSTEVLERLRPRDGG